jgi:hypothetical protein
MRLHVEPDRRGGRLLRNGSGSGSGRAGGGGGYGAADLLLPQHLTKGCRTDAPRKATALRCPGVEGGEAAVRRELPCACAGVEQQRQPLGRPRVLGRQQRLPQGRGLAVVLQDPLHVDRVQQWPACAARPSVRQTNKNACHHQSRSAPHRSCSAPEGGTTAPLMAVALSCTLPKPLSASLPTRLRSPPRTALSAAPQRCAASRTAAGPPAPARRRASTSRWTQSRLA